MTVFFKGNYTVLKYKHRNPKGQIKMTLTCPCTPGGIAQHPTGHYYQSMHCRCVMHSAQCAVNSDRRPHCVGFVITHGLLHKDLKLWSLLKPETIPSVKHKLLCSYIVDLVMRWNRKMLCVVIFLSVLKPEHSVQMVRFWFTVFV